MPELEAHSLYGTQMAKATKKWFDDQNRKALILMEDSWASTGHWAQKWHSNGESAADDMGRSITKLMESSIMGQPFTGADICGELGESDQELCARWHIVGSFYPFSRNYKSYDVPEQPPYNFTDVYEDGV